MNILFTDDQLNDLIDSNTFVVEDLIELYKKLRDRHVNVQQGFNRAYEIIRNSHLNPDLLEEICIIARGERRKNNL